MNISKIRQMVASGDMSVVALRYLLDCHGECEHLDYKQSFDPETDHGCASLGRDAVAMKNVGGGYLVIGVEDKTWRPLGISEPIGLDTKTLRECFEIGLI